VDFILVIIEHFSLGVTVQALQANIDCNSVYLQVYILILSPTTRLFSQPLLVQTALVTLRNRACFGWNGV